MSFLANQALYSSNINRVFEKSQLSFFFFPEIWSKAVFPVNVDIRTFYLNRVNFYRLSLGFSQYKYHMCNLVTSLHGCHKVAVGCWKYYKVVKGCDKVVTRLWQTWHCGHKVALNLWLWRGGGKVVTRLSQGCHKLVTRLQGLYNLATTLSFLYGYYTVCASLTTENIILLFLYKKT